jgi:threonine dehydratase
MFPVSPGGGGVTPTARSWTPVVTPLVPFRGQHRWRRLTLKDETRQHSGAFKYRGAWHRTSLLPPESTLVTASTGNHAAGLATAARARGHRLLVFVPHDTPAAKLQRIAGHGAEVRPVAGDYDDCEALARARAAAGHGTFVHSFDDDDIITGHRGLFCEAAEQGGLPDVVYVPVGGGGLVTAALREWAGRGVEVIGVEYEPAPAMRRSLAQGHRVRLTSATGLPEGLLVRQIGRLPFTACRASGTGIVTVDDRALHRAMALLWRGNGIRAEAAGAAALAAALAAGDSQRTAMAVVSGGNVDDSTWLSCRAAAGDETASAAEAATADREAH